MIRYGERWDSSLNENFICLSIYYNDAFGEDRVADLPFNDPYNQHFDVSRVHIAGRAITGAVLQKAMIVETISSDQVSVLQKEGITQHRWIDSILPKSGNQIYLIESLHPITGKSTFLATARQCQFIGLVSMNVMILDQFMNIHQPIYTTYINPFTGDVFRDG